MAIVASCFGKELGDPQAHSLKRGTVSCLLKLGLNLPDVNVHVGWTYNSVMASKYRRVVHLTEFDKMFFASLL
jgi:hypothetical protein